MIISKCWLREEKNIINWEFIGLFIWTNLNPLHPRMLFAKFGWNWLCGSAEDFKFHTFVIISPWKRAALHFKKSWIPFTQECFVPSVVEIGPVVLEKTMKMWKVYNNNDDKSGNGQQTNFDQKSSLEPLSHLSLKCALSQLKFQTWHYHFNYTNKQTITLVIWYMFQLWYMYRSPFLMVKLGKNSSRAIFSG